MTYVHTDYVKYLLNRHILVVSVIRGRFIMSVSLDDEMEYYKNYPIKFFFKKYILE